MNLALFEPQNPVQKKISDVITFNRRLTKIILFHRNNAVVASKLFLQFQNTV